MLKIYGFVSIITCITACTNNDVFDSFKVVNESSKRKIEYLKFDTVFKLSRDSIRGPITTTVARNNNFYLYDYGTRTLKSYDSNTGKLMWSFDGASGDSTTISSFSDFDVDSHGKVWISSNKSSKIIVLDSNGKFNRIVYASGIRRIWAIAVLDTNIVLTTNDNSKEIANAIDSTGTNRKVITNRYALPNRPYRQATYSRADRSDSGNEWIEIFPHRNLFISYSGLIPRCVGRYAQADSSETPTRVPTIAISATVSDSTIYIIPNSKLDSTVSRNVVDEYSSSTCVYRRSIKLPVRTNSIAVANGILYMMYNDSLPNILGIKPIK